MCGKIATQPSKRNPTKNRAIDHAEPWRGADLVRVVQQIVKLHALGPRLLFEFLAELAADFVVRDDIEHLLFRYGRLDPALVAALDARRPRLPVVIFENDEIREISA